MQTNGTSEVPKKQWWWSTPFVIFMLLSVGPLALPLLWFNPRYSTAQKILWTAVTAAATYALWVAGVKAYNQFMEQARSLGLIQ